MGCNILERMKADNQPLGGVEIVTADNVSIMQISAFKGTEIPQHSHEYDHTTLVTSGKVKVFRGDKCLGIYTAPSTVYIMAGEKHRFEILEDADLWCIHNIARNGSVEVKAEHRLCLGE